MLVASLAFSLLVAEPAVSQPALQTCPDGSVIRQDDRCLVFDHRDQFSVAPEVETKTIEWRCGRRTARARIRTVELPFKNQHGEPVSKHRFKVELTELQVDGVRASKATQDRVRAALGPLNSVSQLYGRCFANVFELNVGGYSLSDPPRELRRARIELK